MVLVNYTRVFIVLFCAIRKVAGDASHFRILAPEIVCPKDENAIIEKPDHVVITLQTESDDLKFSWTVRWVMLDTPTQRFTLMLWRTVRALEAQLNTQQPDPFAYVINNTQLLGGVDYIFNITSSSEEDINGSTKSFHIDNIKGDQKLIVDGRSDKFSVFLVGGVKIFTDMPYVLVAEVTTCNPVQDYYFAWNVEASGNIINVDDISGWRLEIPPYSLRAGEFYYIACRVYRNGSLVTQTELPFEVLFRGLRVFLNVDVLFVTSDKAFTLEAFVENHDYYEETPLYEWSCTYQDEPCEKFESSDTEILLFSDGLPGIGQYEINLLVKVLDQHGSAKAIVNIVEPILPVIQHGEALTDSLTIFSLEENFLNEITDFTNDTEWRQVTAEMQGAEGRARFVAKCGCSLTFSCKTEGMAYAEINFQMNPAPIVADIKISPESGTAMETVFRISRLSASDPDKPLMYSLLCSLGDENTLVLGSNLEHLNVDTFLPFLGADAAGTDIWAEVCDSYGACSSSTVMTIPLLAGEARSKDLLVEDMRGYVLRCEVMLLNQVILSTIITYSNANQEEALAAFTDDVLQTLPSEDHCLKKHQEYWTMLHWLAARGIDTSALE